jgi:hypothetical protein
VPKAITNGYNPHHRQDERMRGRKRERTGDMPRRALRRSDSDRIGAIARDAEVPVEEVLRDVAEFRLALETDMIVAAAAADAEAPELLSDVLDGERAELADFHDRLLERLVDAAVTDELALRRARRAPISLTSKVVASVAAVVALLGAGRVVVNNSEGGSNRAALAAASEQYNDLSSAINQQSPSAVASAAQQLHQTLQTLISQHAADPEVAQRAAQLLQAEISLLQVRDPAGSSQVLAQARTLANLLKRSAPPSVRASVAPILDAASPSPKPSPTKAAKPKPTASPTPSPKASSSPSTSSSAKDGEGTHLP